MRHAWRPLFVYAAVAVAFTWPLALHPVALLGAPIGPGDPYLNLWILGWDMHAILTDPASILSGRVFDANIFYPAAGTLAYSDHLLLQSAVLTPLYAITGNVVLCYNVLLLGSLAGSALAMHAFVRRIVGSTGGAYVAGLAWGFGSFRFAHLIHLQLQALYWLPLAFLVLHRLVAGRRRRDALALGAIVGLQGLSSVYFAVIGGVALIVGAIAVTVVAGRRDRRRLVGRLVMAGLVAGALVLPAGVVYWRVQQREGFGRNLFEASRNAAFADSYLQAPPGNLLYGRTGILRRPAETPGGDVPHTGPEREIFPGVALTLLALLGVWFGWRSDARPLVAAMVAVGVVGFVLSFGPDGLREVYAALHRYVFGFQAIRAPARFAVLVAFGLATLAAVGWRELAARAHRAGATVPRAVTVLAVVLVAVECAHLPTRYAAAPPLHTGVGAWLAQAPGPGAVAVLPLGLDIDSTPAMVQSLEHFRPLVNGYSGQRPAFYAALVEAVNTFPSDESVLALHETGVRFVVSPQAVPPSEGAGWPLVERATFPAGTIYELVWSAAADARFAHLSSIVPPPPGPVPFGPGEEATYDVSWDGAGMNLSAGTIVVSVQAPAYRFVVSAKTAPWVARFFEADDRFETIADGRLLPEVHQREQNEGARHVTRAYLYDFPAGVLRSGRTEAEARAPEAMTSPLPPEARDAISALFYMRTLPFDPGTVVRVPINEAGRNLIVDLRAVGPEPVLVDGQTVDAIRIAPEIEARGGRRQRVTAVVWISADRRRVPLVVDLDAGFGHLRMELKDYRSTP